MLKAQVSKNQSTIGQSSKNKRSKAQIYKSSIQGLSLPLALVTASRLTWAGVAFGAFLLLGTSLALASPVYKTVDENGRVTYSDAPSGQKIEEVDLPQINETPAVNPQPYEPARSQTPGALQFSVNITSPTDGSYIPPGQRDLTVTANILPGLSGGYVARLMHNGSPMGQPQSSGTFVIPNISRGAHTLRVVIYSAEGQPVGSSPPVTANVIRAQTR